MPNIRVYARVRACQPHSAPVSFSNGLCSIFMSSKCVLRHRVIFVSDSAVQWRFLRIAQSFLPMANNTGA